MGTDAGQDQQPSAESFENAFDVGAETLAYQIIAGIAGRRTRTETHADGKEPGASRSLLRQARAWLGFG
jgi:hypothetical protein